MLHWRTPRTFCHEICLTKNVETKTPNAASISSYYYVTLSLKWHRYVPNMLRVFTSTLDMLSWGVEASWAKPWDAQFYGSL